MPRQRLLQRGQQSLRVRAWLHPSRRRKLHVRRQLLEQLRLHG
jgi:hypothetical protein